MSDLFTHKKLETRWACAENPKGAKSGACRPETRLYAPHAQMTHDRKTSPCLAPLKDKQTHILAESSEGPGTVRRIWITLSDRSSKMLRGLRLECFWDGASEPAVSVPLGDFFCQSLGRMNSFHNALFSSPEAKSFNSFVPMPFKKSFKMMVTNESGSDLEMFFYQVDWTLGDNHGPDTLWFHAHWRRENPTTLCKDFVFLPYIKGRGRYLGVNFGVITDQTSYQRSWWGEGEVKIFLDGDTQYPTLCGTGTEDYIGTGWGQGRYNHLYQGCPLSDNARMIYGFYRLHIQDPVFFQKEIRATIQQIGSANPEERRQLRRRWLPLYYGEELADLDKYGNYERQDDWSSCVWFYLDRTTNGFPSLPPVAERTAYLLTD